MPAEVKSNEFCFTVLHVSKHCACIHIFEIKEEIASSEISQIRKSQNIFQKVQIWSKMNDQTNYVSMISLIAAVGLAINIVWICYIWKVLVAIPTLETGICVAFAWIAITVMFFVGGQTYFTLRYRFTKANKNSVK